MILVVVRDVSVCGCLLQPCSRSGVQGGGHQPRCLNRFPQYLRLAGRAPDTGVLDGHHECQPAQLCFATTACFEGSDRGGEAVRGTAMATGPRAASQPSALPLYTDGPTSSSAASFLPKKQA